MTRMRPSPIQCSDDTIAGLYLDCKPHYEWSYKWNKPVLVSAFGRDNLSYRKTSKPRGDGVNSPSLPSLNNETQKR